MKRITFLAVGLTVLSMLIASSGFSLSSSIAASPSPYLATTEGGDFNGQRYSGTLMGNTLWTNNSFPFQNYISSSKILSLTAVKSDLSTYAGISNAATSNLRPYLSLYPSVGNPYDFAQGIVGNKKTNTLYYVYEYVVPASGLIIGFWITPTSPRHVEHVFTYDENPRSSITVADQPVQSSYLSPLSGSVVKSTKEVGYESYQSTYYTGAIMTTSVFGNLKQPSGCLGYSTCWLWENWIGFSDYDWVSSAPSNPWLFVAAIEYWGGNVGQSSTDCASSSSFSPQNCNAFVYYQGSTSSKTYNPGVGGWTGGDGVSMEWYVVQGPCILPSGYSGTIYGESITDTTTSAYSSFAACMYSTNYYYTQFFEQRPIIGSTVYENPEFGTHYFYACLGQSTCSYPIDPSGSIIERVNLYNTGKTALLVSASGLTSGSTSSTWSDTWSNSGF